MAKMVHKLYQADPEALIYMGIDQSLTTTGVTVFRKTGKTLEELLDPSNVEVIYSEAIETKPDYGEVEMRIALIRERVLEISSDFQVYSIGIESLAYRGFAGAQASNARILAGVFFSILSGMFTAGVNYHVVNIKSVKKFATGSGNADKEDLMKKIPEEDLLILEKYSTKKIGSKKFFDIVDSYWMGKFAIQEDIQCILDIKSGKRKNQKS